MKVLVGLGNPGRKYSKTKHNFGFWIIESFLKHSSLTLQAGKGDYHYLKTNDLNTSLIFFIIYNTFLTTYKL